VENTNLPNNPGELWGALMDPVGVPIWGPQMITSYTQQAPFLKKPSAISMVVDQNVRTNDQVIHISYNGATKIWHIGVKVMALNAPHFQDHQVQGAALANCDHPSIDVNPCTGQVHIAYESGNNIYYDRLLPGVQGGNIFLQANNPTKVDDKQGAEDSKHPQIRLDRQLVRRSDLSWRDGDHDDASAHIVWTSSLPGANQWRMSYAKYSPGNNAPVVTGHKILDLEPYFAHSISPLVSDMEINSENQLHVTFVGRTLGFTFNIIQNVQRLFHLMLDNNGEILTMVTRISTEDELGPVGTNDIINIGSALSPNGRVFAVHDYQDPVTSIYTGMIDIESMKDIGSYAIG